MNFAQADALLQDRNYARRKIGNNTYLLRTSYDVITIRLHATDIITLYDDGRTVVTSGGWQTVTTKARLNKYLPLSISQRAGAWYWSTGDEFKDGDTIKDGGLV